VNLNVRSLELLTQKLTMDIYASYFTKSSGWDMKTWKKNLTSYAYPNLLISLISYPTFTKLTLTNLALFHYLNSDIILVLSSFLFFSLSLLLKTIALTTVTYHLTSTLFLLSFSVDHTLFQSFYYKINYSLVCDIWILDILSEV